MSNANIFKDGAQVQDASGHNIICADPSLCAVSEGSGIAGGVQSHAEGYGTSAGGYASHAEGYDTSARGIASHAENNGQAGGDWSHAEGYGSNASGNISHAEGVSASSSGYASHAEGYSQAQGSFSHAEGYATRAEGCASHAEGNDTYATGYGCYSHASGEGSMTRTPAQYAHSGGNINCCGDAQYSRYNLQGVVCGLGSLQLCQYNINMPSDAVWSFEVSVAVRDTASGNGGVLFFRGIACSVSGSVTASQGVSESQGLLFGFMSATVNSPGSGELGICYSNTCTNVVDVAAVIKTSEVI